MAQITISPSGKKLEILAGKSVGSILTENGIFISKPCGGIGTCGKCRIKIISGEMAASDKDTALLSDDDIRSGIRLACQAYPSEDIVIEILNNEDDISVLAHTSQDDAKVDPSNPNNPFNSQGAKLGVAIDIGTTTLAAALVNIDTQEQLAWAAGVNHQRTYGADVVSRIQASNQGNGEILKDIIRTDIGKLYDKLMTDAGIGHGSIENIVIAGNTTMIHLLMGYPCDGLGVYPFTPYSTERVTGNAVDILGIDINVPVTVMPGISAYVGGDIVAGLLSLEADKREKPIAFIDLGTNGEMAVGNKDSIMVTSAAAGPAFEGGNISSGMGSVPGAVCSITICDGQVSLRTINNEMPKGLCGTGVIELTAELLKNGIIDKTGLMDESLGDKGFAFAKTQTGENLYFTPKDVREIQMAKAAISAGLETLLDRYGRTWDEIDEVYIAGGFGYYMDIKKATDIGLMPTKVLNKAKAVGNSSLQGAVDWLVMPDALERTEKIINVSQEISLAMDTEFSDRYINSMVFG